MHRIVYDLTNCKQTVPTEEGGREGGRMLAVAGASLLPGSSISPALSQLCREKQSEMENTTSRLKRNLHLRHASAAIEI